MPAGNIWKRHVFGLIQMLQPLAFYPHKQRLGLGSFWFSLSSRKYLFSVPTFIHFCTQSSTIYNSRKRSLCNCFKISSSLTYISKCRWQRNIIQTFMYWQVRVASLILKYEKLYIFTWHYFVALEICSESESEAALCFLPRLLSLLCSLYFMAHSRFLARFLYDFHILQELLQILGLFFDLKIAVQDWKL